MNGPLPEAQVFITYLCCQRKWALVVGVLRKKFQGSTRGRSSWVVARLGVKRYAVREVERQQALLRVAPRSL